MKREQVFEFYRRLAEANPAPTTELDYSNPYTLLVAVVLSALGFGQTAGAQNDGQLIHAGQTRLLLGLREDSLYRGALSFYNPGGLALRGRSAYVSNCSVCAQAGSVVRISLG